MRTGISSLDFRLGLRMLVRYPGLTLVGGLAIAFAIWVGAGAFEIIGQVLHPRLPLPGGGRIVGITTVDRTTARTEVPSLHDYARWDEELRTVEELGAALPTASSGRSSDGRWRSSGWGSSWGRWSARRSLGWASGP